MYSFGSALRRHKPQDILRKKKKKKKRDVHTYKLNFTLKTLPLGTVLFAKQEIDYSLFKGESTGHSYSCCLKGKVKGIVGDFAMFFLLRGVLGSVNCAIHYKQDPWGAHGGKTGRRICAQTRLSITSLTQWRQEQSEKQTGPQRHQGEVKTND